MVFQDPLTSLNPTLTIGDQIVETILEHRGTHPASFLGTPPEAGREGVKKKITRAEAWVEAEELLRQVHMTLPERRMRQYPFELSGGMRQRAMIAMAFSCRPELLIADEPTTALDVTVQAQILDLMDELRQNYGTSIMLITHDLGVVSERCDNVAVMYAGRIVEYAPTRELFDNPRHPYTQALLASLPDWRRPRTDTPLPTLPGQPPSLTADTSAGCPFAPRCPQVMDACSTTTPAQTFVDADHYARCLRVEGKTEPS
jgi:peptide/nickel transport system ATP-binding protein